MSEFNNRIATQREILLGVNDWNWKEDLFGLSSGAIDRWVVTNKLGNESCLVNLIRQAAEKLFFLSNKSQEQVTEDYRHLSEDVSVLTNQIIKAASDFHGE